MGLHWRLYLRIASRSAESPPRRRARSAIAVSGAPASNGAPGGRRCGCGQPQRAQQTDDQVHRLHAEFLRQRADFWQCRRSTDRLLGLAVQPDKSPACSLPGSASQSMPGPSRASSANADRRRGWGTGLSNSPGSATGPRRTARGVIGAPGIAGRADPTRAQLHRRSGATSRGTGMLAIICS